MWLRAVGTYTDPQGPGKTAVSNIRADLRPRGEAHRCGGLKDETYNSFKVTWTASTATAPSGDLSYDVEWRKAACPAKTPRSTGPVS